MLIVLVPCGVRSASGELIGNLVSSLGWHHVAPLIHTHTHTHTHKLSIIIFNTFNFNGKLNHLHLALLLPPTSCSAVSVGSIGNLNHLHLIYILVCVYICMYIYIYPHGGRDTVLVIFGGKIRSCEKSAGPINCSVHRTCCPVRLGDFSHRLLVYNVMKTKQFVTRVYCILFNIIYYIVLILLFDFDVFVVDSIFKVFTSYHQNID